MNPGNDKPIVLLTLGDPAGVGPEVVAKALTHPQVHDACYPVVVGDAPVLERATVWTGARLRLRVRQVFEVPSAEEILVVDTRSGGDAAPVGRVSAAGGRAAFAALKTAVTLCLENHGVAIATAPINKESLKAAGVPYLDHTEALQRLTGAEAVFTLFVTGNLRVFFLTRHVPFRDIPHQIRRERIVSFTRQCVAQLARLGFASPRVAVAALNPHAGEGGMFGDEEIREIRPAVEDLQREGYDVQGPIPADSVFHLAKEGHFDAVISLYHDQGHIATKTLDFHRTVSLTLGLPFLRSSVDHGTAFDLAGSGQANELSMVEAILAAARYGPPWRSTAK
ncbi:MAG: 4-hydroxythreonine-4-phosphate dehydrogenase PdxA [candidate division KSB1 bacterium]|nr:4-hydroxythreonine-4-phosphate dehydrogenase PdxA [candidate division KSB1 bacterium]